MSLARLHLHSHTSSQKGSTLIEVLIAATIVVLVLVAIASLMSLVLRNQRASSGQQQATKYAQQSVEWFRQIRDNVGWRAFYDAATPATRCMPIVPTTADVASLTGLSSSGCATFPADYVKYDTTVAHTDAGNFTRTIVITRPTAESVQVVATVFWTEGTKQLDSTVTLILRKWK